MDVISSVELSVRVSLLKYAMYTYGHGIKAANKHRLGGFSMPIQKIMS